MSQVFKFFTFVFSGERISRSANHSGLVPLIDKLGYTSDLSSSRLTTHFPRSVWMTIVSVSATNGICPSPIVRRSLAKSATASLL